jgi:hypothetical protein
MYTLNTHNTKGLYLTEVALKAGISILEYDYRPRISPPLPTSST